MNKLIKVLQENFDPSWWVNDIFQNQDQIKELHSRINTLNPKLVIDAGCGNNIHKNKINNLIGFDAMPFPDADQHCTILDAKFNSNSADVVIAYGSIQFLDEQFVRKNLKKIISWIKCNGLLEMKVNGKYINGYIPAEDRYWWCYRRIDKFTTEFNLEFKIKPYSINTKIGPRIFWTWKKPY